MEGTDGGMSPGDLYEEEERMGEFPEIEWVEPDEVLACGVENPDVCESCQ